MCGSENRLYKAKIEGTMLNVCRHCARFGEIAGKVHDKKFLEKKKRQREKKRKPLAEKEINEVIASDYNKLIKKKRESMGLKQEELADKINEKVSIIHKIETGSFEPSIKLARKLEKFLKLKLVEQRSFDKKVPKGSKSEGFTLGDFIKVRK